MARNVIVQLIDPDEEITVNWAHENCPSFCSWLIYESPYTQTDDAFVEIHYEFFEEKDATMFLLKFGSQ